MPAVAAPKPGESQRLSATLALSLIVHGMLVLGLGFALDDAAPVVPTLDVILSQTQTPLTPKQADFLAATNQEGGGDQDKT
ncbi:MAG: energy transducer TonB, partial [Pseudoxanthomonas sp.]|nr:energy transducer TonB [Pseudoxanthomonas sp.]